MPRKKKDSFDKLLDALEDPELDKRALQLVQRIVDRRLKRREYSHASEEPKAATFDGLGPSKSSSGKKDGDGDVSPPAKEDG